MLSKCLSDCPLDCKMRSGNRCRAYLSVGGRFFVTKPAFWRVTGTCFFYWAEKNSDMSEAVLDFEYFLEELCNVRMGERHEAQ